jgi:hypothetical protein
LVCAGLVLSGSVALAQNYSTTGSQMVGVPQIIRLSQAKVSDDTIIAYVNNSGFSYSLDADQIINLRQQGVSDAVITTMLNQPKTGPVVYTPPAPQQVASSANTSTSDTTPLYSPRQSDQMPAASASTQPVPTATVAPAVTYVQAAPAPVYYYPQPYYYPSYAWFPPVLESVRAPN